MPARVLAIESDVRQGTILKRIVKDKVHADLVLVDSRDAAIASINTSIPDVILVTALLSPRDEEELIAHLRTLDGADHLQLHTIPQLASGREDGDGGGAGLFGKLKKKKEAPIPGCDPDLFAEEIRSFLDAAEQAKAMAASNVHRRKRFDPSAPSADPSASSGFADFAADSHTAGEAHGASAPGGGAGLDEGVIGGSAGDSAW
ncbi:MAG TPA: hypothetical protein VG106_15365, partial [Vicinamibacterales bacterium]|nr:hypothetical protein [Vicinamibacterales bacterium]